MDNYDANYRSITADPLYPDVAEKAKKKGFRLATAGEVRASANCEWYASDLYYAYGVNWVRDDRH